MSTRPKRQSILSELGIKPGAGVPGESAPGSPSRGSTPSPTPARSPAQPTPSRATSISRRSATPTNTATPKATKRLSGSTRPASMHGASAPASPSTTTNARRTLSSQPVSPAASPMARRASTTRSASGTPKRLSSPIEPRARNDSPDIVKDLQIKLAALEERDSKSNEELAALKQKVAEQQNELELQKKEQQVLLEKTVQERMDLFIEEQEQGAVADREALEAEHKDQMAKIALAHDKQVHELKSQFASVEAKAQQQQMSMLQQLQAMSSKHDDAVSALQNVQKERDTLSARVHELEAAVAQAKDGNRVHELEVQLAASQQTNEVLERRFRSEMQQTRKDHDDTAQSWLEKHQRSQFELDRLQQSLAEAENRHNEEFEALEAKYKADADAQKQEAMEQRDLQQQLVDSLEQQVDELHSRLEEATERLEQHAANLKPSLSLHSSNSARTTTPPAVEQHLQDRINDLERANAELRERELEMQQKIDAQEQLNQQLRQEQQHQLSKSTDATPSSEYTSSSLEMDAHMLSSEYEQQLVDIARQHQRELQLLHDQYQQLLDTKDKDLEAYAFRVTSLGITKRNDLEACRLESTNKINALEQNIEGYESTLRTYTTKLSELESQLDQDGQLRSELDVLRTENKHLVRLVDQLQGELHPQPR
ncbi:hypothetical protein BC940DRAFT_330880 [Gongronella butleri]|nr:hypothetical protein BC940DRAFT_330880 [Gongronella butleri]